MRVRRAIILHFRYGEASNIPWFINLGFRRRIDHTCMCADTTDDATSTRYSYFQAVPKDVDVTGLRIFRETFVAHPSSCSR